jgi:hypothetical protein
MWGRSIQNPWLTKTNSCSYSNPIERDRRDKTEYVQPERIYKLPGKKTI